MCFTKAINSKRQIADKDIRCYKILVYKNENSALAKIYTYTYKFGSLHVIPDLKLNNKKLEINKGFHSYVYYESIENFRMKKRLKTIIANLDMFGAIVAVRCIIPKGSFYWKNNDEYVSNQIIVKEYIK